MGICSSSTSPIQPSTPSTSDDNFTDLRQNTKRIMKVVKPRLKRAVLDFQRNTHGNGELSFDRIVPTEPNARPKTIKQRRQHKTNDINLLTDRHIAALVGSDQLNSPLLNQLISLNPQATSPTKTMATTNNTPPTFEKMTDPSSGKMYYFCEATGETQWDMPKNFIETKPVTCLSFCDHDITNEGCPYLATVLKWSHTCLALTVLRLRQNNITDQGAELLADVMFSPNCRIQHLELQDNAIGDGGVKALALSLQNGVLTHLSLDRQQGGRNNKISHIGIEALANGLSKKTCKLEKLSLSGNKSVDCTCATMLAKALVAQGGGSRLKELYLSGTGISDAGGSALASCLFTLHNLSLSGCRLTDVGGNAIALAEPGAKQLKGLDVQGNKFSPSTIQSLIDNAMPDCFVSVSLNSGSSYSN